MKDIVYPSLLEANNTAPFKAGTCYRQVHLWADEGRSFSRRVGDFPCAGLPCGVRLVVDNEFETLKSSDAVVLFHRTKLDWAELHRHKPRGQKWIFYTQETPINTDKHVIPQKEFYNNSYDYIMSYRFRESHLYGSYGRYNTDHPEMKLTERRNWSRNKTRPVAWVASNCNGAVSWDRNGFVDALSRYVPVSMYRKSGTKDCPMDERCNRSIRKHKFYLALENSPCRDYISEELWRNALLNNLVPRRLRGFEGGLRTRSTARFVHTRRGLRFNQGTSPVLAETQQGQGSVQHVLPVEEVRMGAAYHRRVSPGARASV